MILDYRDDESTCNIQYDCRYQIPRTMSITPLDYMKRGSENGHILSLQVDHILSPLLEIVASVRKKNNFINSSIYMLIVSYQNIYNF